MSALTTRLRLRGPCAAAALYRTADVRRVGEELGLGARGEEAAAALQARVDRALALAAELASAAGATAQPKKVRR